MAKKVVMASKVFENAINSEKIFNSNCYDNTYVIQALMYKLIRWYDRWNKKVVTPSKVFGKWESLKDSYMGIGQCPVIVGQNTVNIIPQCPTKTHQI